MGTRQNHRWQDMDDARLAALREGQLLRVMVGRTPVCFARSAGTLHAVEDVCPHQGQSFAGGTCENGRIICPWHLKSFDVRTGEGLTGSEGGVRVFSVEEKDGRVRIGLPHRGISLFGWRIG